MKMKTMLFVLACIAMTPTWQTSYGQTIRTWTGSGGNNHFMNSQNWDPVAQPNSSDSIIIYFGNIVLDASDGFASIGSLTLGGSLAITGVGMEISHSMEVDGSLTLNQFSSLTVGGDVTINGTVQASPGMTTSIICGGSWIISSPSSFSPGNSTVTFQGSGDFAGQFYDLYLDGSASMGSNGNVLVNDYFSIGSNLNLRPADTLVIQNTSVFSMVGSGKIHEGTISRAIEPSYSFPYRFGSDSTYVQFDGSGSCPTMVTMTSHPSDSIPDCGDTWEALPGSVDTVNNIVRATNVTHFTQWALGVPRPLSPPSIDYGNYEVNSSNTCDSFSATLAIQYEQSQVVSGLHEDSLQLLRSYSSRMNSPVEQGWNLFSLPLKVTKCNTKRILFPTAISSAFRYSNGYVAKDTLENGSGFWLKFPSPQSVPLKGLSRKLDTISVNTGWNIIGTLSSSLPASSIVTVPPDLVLSPYFGYRGVYEIATVLEPARGYWVKIKPPGGKMILSSSGIAPFDASRNISKVDLESFNRLTISDVLHRERALFIGPAVPGMSPDDYELPPIPPQGVFDARFASGGYALCMPPGVREDRVALTIASNGPVTFSWQPVDRQLKAFLLMKSGEVMLQPFESIVLAIPPSGILLDLRRDNHADLPREFGLSQNFPNPFNPATVIRYQLPVQSHVALKIYDVLGQLVMTLVDGIRDAGYESVEWDASTVGSGIYYCRLQAANVDDLAQTFSQVRTMVILR